MKRLVAIILIAVGVVAAVVPECLDFPATASTEITSQSSSSSPDPVISASLVSEKHSAPDQGCGNHCDDPTHACHQCHFGHCGFLVGHAKFSPSADGSGYGSNPQSLVLKSFIPSLFRPPIA